MATYSFMDVTASLSGPTGEIDLGYGSASSEEGITVAMGGPKNTMTMDLQNDRGEPVISGIPLVTGADLLAQYAYMGLGFKLVVVCDDSTQDYPTKTDLGGRSHLLVSTE